MSGVIGVATVSGKPLAGGTVQIFDRRGASQSKKRLRPRVVRTNRRGGFRAGVRDLPRIFVVEVSGGKIGGRRFGQSVKAFGKSSERGVYVNPASTLAVALSRSMPRWSPVHAVKQTRTFLGVPKLPGGLMALGQVTNTQSRAFSPSKFMSSANRQGGLARFTAKLAHAAANPRKRQRFVSANASSAFAAADDSGLTVLDGVLTTLVYAPMCFQPMPSLTTALACPDDPDDIDAQLSTLQSSITNVQMTMDDMEMESDEVTSESAQQAYSQAFDYSGTEEIAATVSEAASDLNMLNAAASVHPEPTTVSPTSSLSQQCAAIYVNTYTDGSDPYDLCVDFLEQTSSFSDPQVPGYATLYYSLTGANEQPQNNLLPWTYQGLFTAQSSGNPLSQSQLTEIQEDVDEIGQLQDDAFAMLADAQGFQYFVTSGLQASCPTVQTTGTLQATTPITVSSVCGTAQTSLFEASVENYMAPPLWQLNQFTGPPSSGVPAMNVPPPSSS